MSTSSISPPTACPRWCTLDPCTGDHWGDPGSTTWPEVAATNDAEQGAPTFTAYPSWDSRCPTPGVSVWIQSEHCDYSAELTPDEATALAQNLLRAAKVVKAG